MKIINTINWPVPLSLQGLQSLSGVVFGGLQHMMDGCICTANLKHELMNV